MLTASPHPHSGVINIDDPGKYLAFLGRSVLVVIDRPKGSRHPEHGFTYEADYGYVPGTLAGDGEEIDAYVLGLDGPVEQFRGTCIGVIVRKDDNEHKLVVSRQSFDVHQIRRQTLFVERFYHSDIIVPAP